MERARRKQKAVGALLILLACSPCAFALNPSLEINQYAHNAWKIRDGFFKGGIWSIAQTPDGYLWLGTATGLLRFDGVRTVPWQPPEGQQLPNNLISNLLVGRDGRLWIATPGGLASWKDGKLANYPELAGRLIVQLLEDREGTLWFTDYRLESPELCAIRSGTVSCVGKDGGFSRGIGGLYEDRAGNLWVGGVASLWRWKPGPPKLYRMPDLDQVHTLIEDDNGNILIGLRSGIRRLVNGKTEALRLPIPATPVGPEMFLRDRDGGLWIGTDGGLFHIHHGKTDHFGQLDGLSGDGVIRLFEDREGNIWVATSDGGLDRFRDFAAPTITVRQGLSGEVVSLLGARDGSVWLATPHGLDRWRDRQMTIYRKQSSGLPDDYLERVFEDDRGRIWVFTFGGDAYFENGRFVRVSGVPSRYVQAVTEDADGSLWISHDQGLFHLVEGRVAERIPWSSLGLKGWAITLIHDSARGGLWLGFFDGGVAFFKDGKVQASYGIADGLGGGIVSGLRLDRDGTLWAATDGGLSRLKDGRIATMTSRNGLPCDAVKWMMEGDDLAFWVSTACGLVRIERPELEAWSNDPKRTVKVTIFDSSDGFISTPIIGRVAKATDGRLWFPTLGGVSVVDPHHLPFNKLMPPVHIENIKADGKIHDLSKGSRLPPLTRDVSIDYTALSFVAPEKVHFRYKLEGQDSDWKEVVNDRHAHYSNLAPRTYRFRVMASNNNGVWNEAGALLDFSVAPAYYQTLWFRLSTVAVFFAAVAGVYRLRLQQMSRQFDLRMTERVNERTRIARDLHDTLLQSFQGVLMQFEAVKYLLPGRVEEARKLLGTGVEQARQAVKEGRDAIQGLRSSTVLTNDLAKSIQALGEELVTSGAVPNCPEVRVRVEGDSRELVPGVRDEIYRIASEAIRNACHHSEASRVDATIQYGDKQFRLRVSDNGKGIDPAILAAGGRAGHHGLPGLYERAKLAGGKLTLTSNPNAGTEVELTIPASFAYSNKRVKPPSA